MQEPSTDRMEESAIVSPKLDRTAKPLTLSQNVALTIKIFLVVGAVVGVLWLLDGLAS